MPWLPFTYLAKGRYWRFRHAKVGDMPIAGEAFGSDFLTDYIGLIERAGENLSAGQIERARRAFESDQEHGSVYFIGWDRGPIKIGVAIDIRRRLASLQCASPYPLLLLASCGGGRIAERRYHLRFQQHRLLGEWFERHPEIEAEIDRLTNKR